MELTTQNIDKITCELYIEFYEKNPNLLKSDPQEYAHKSFAYVLQYKRDRIKDKLNQTAN